jgi:thiol-disulfide isomerase/thioredoxin
MKSREGLEVPDPYQSYADTRHHQQAPIHASKALSLPHCSINAPDQGMAPVQSSLSRTNRASQDHTGVSRRPRRGCLFTLRAKPVLLFLMFSFLIDLSSRLSPSLAFTVAFQSHRCRRKDNIIAMHGTSSKSGGHLLKTSAEYETAIAGGGTTTSDNYDLPALVWFTAPWCGPCRLSIPVVKDIIKQFGGKLLPYEICTDDLPDVAAAAGVVSIPTIQLYFRGTYLYSLSYRSVRLFPLTIAWRLYTYVYRETHGYSCRLRCQASFGGVHR